MTARRAFVLISRLSYQIAHSLWTWQWFTRLLPLGDLAAARDIENAKSAKYRAVASERGASFLAFIAESYGALGNQAGEVLKWLNNTLNQAPARPFELSERAVAETLSVALQRGNAFISHMGSLTVRAQAARVN